MNLEPEGTPNPVRLRLDPDFRAETGCDLSDEAAVTGGYDHARGKQRLLAAIAALPPPGGPTAGPASGAGASSASGVMLAGAFGAAVVGIALLVGAWSTAVPSAAPQVAPPTHVAAPTAPDAAPAGSPELTAGPASLPTEPVVASSPRAPMDQRIARVGSPPPAVVVGPVEVPPTVEAPVAAVLPSTPTEPAIAPSGLQADYAAFLAGDAAFKDGDFAAARDGYRGYLASHPDGAMEPEAQLGLLLALHQLGDARAAELQARTIQDRSIFSSRRVEILRVRAESLVLLDRCDEALSLADQLASKDAAEARRVCRARRKGEP
jgi:TolA-binding protein